MKKFFFATLAILAAACYSPAPATLAMDPCSQASFNEVMCQQAIAQQGYYYDNVFYPISYSHPYTYYYGGYHTYVVHGGVVHHYSPSVYSHTATATTYRRPSYSSPSTAARTSNNSSFSRYGANRSTFSRPSTPSYSSPRSYSRPSYSSGSSYSRSSSSSSFRSYSSSRHR